MKTLLKLGIISVLTIQDVSLVQAQTVVWTSGFESGNSSFSSDATTGTIAQPNGNNARTGTYSGKIAGTAGANNPYDGSIITGLISFSSVKLYKVSVYAKAEKCTGKLEIRKSATATNAAIKSASGNDAILTSASNNVTSSTYTEYSTYFTVGSDESKYVGFQMTGSGCGGTGSAIIYIDDIVITEMSHPIWTGSSSSDWNTAANWDFNDIPTQVMNVTFPSGASCNISSSTTALCNNLTVDASASLTVATTSGLGYLDVYGNITNNGTLNHTGTASIYMNGTGKTIGGSGNFSGNTKVYFWNGSTTSLAGNISLYNITIYNNASTSLDLGTYTLTVNNTLTQSGMLNLNTGTLEYKGTATPTLTDSRFNENTGTFYYAGTAAALCIADGITYNNLKININNAYSTHISCAGSTFYDFTISGNLEFINPDAGNSGTVHLHQNITINGNITIPSGTTFESNSKNITLKGNWINNGSFDASTALVTLNGTSAQDIGGSNATSFYKLTINKTSGTTTLSRNTTVSNVLTLTAGALNLNAYTLSLTKTHAASPTGTNNSISRTNGYITSENVTNASKVIWYMGTVASHTYPFANNSGTYIPFIFNVTGGTSGNVTVSTYPTGNDNQPLPSSPDVVTHINNALGEDNSSNTANRFWQIDAASALTADITFTYAEADVPPVGEADLRAQRWNGNGWSEAIAGQTLNTTNNTVLVPGVSSFSPWTLASNSSPLPVRLLSFNAAQKMETIELSWSTSSEINNDYFTVEKSKDGIHFEFVAKIKGAGNSNRIINYSTPDPEPWQGTSYYRLKQTDFDGSFSFSNVVDVKYELLDNPGMVIFPNPSSFSDVIKIKITGIQSSDVRILILDFNGMKISDYFIINEMESGLIIEPRFALSPGLYTIICTIEHQSVIGKLVVK